MNKEEILAKSRKENKNLDLAELEIQRKGAHLAGLIAAIMCITFFTIEWVLFDRASYGYYSIFSMFAAVSQTYRAFKLRKTQHIVTAMMWCIAAVLVLITYIMRLEMGSKR